MSPDFILHSPYRESFVIISRFVLARIADLRFKERSISFMVDVLDGKRSELLVASVVHKPIVQHRLLSLATG